MISSVEIYARLEQRFAEWSLTRQSIAAVIVVGSWARAEHPADEWSDLDLVAFASDAASYLHEPAWLNTFGRHDQEWIALYDDGSKLDVAWLSIDPAAAPTLQAMLDAFPYPNVLQRGVRVLIDKTGSPLHLRWPKIDTPQLPEAARLSVCIMICCPASPGWGSFVSRHRTYAVVPYSAIDSPT
jgi:aminoglycoside 6-adenylyltransferase